MPNLGAKSRHRDWKVTTWLRKKCIHELLLSATSKRKAATQGGSLSEFVYRWAAKSPAKFADEMVR
jgi:hypothetical protein